MLVDEINRTGPKTQSALLEAMEERQVSVDRSTFDLPPDFLLIATQNPREFEGTYPLPESQLDRFMLRLDMQYPTRAAEAEILARYGGMGTAAQEALASVTALDRALLRAARADVETVHVSEALSAYVLDLAAYLSRTRASCARTVHARGTGAAQGGAHPRRAARR